MGFRNKKLQKTEREMFQACRNQNVVDLCKQHEPKLVVIVVFSGFGTVNLAASFAPHLHHGSTISHRPTASTLRGSVNCVGISQSGTATEATNGCENGKLLYLGKKKWMIYEDSINASLVGVEEIHRLCPIANGDLHHTQGNVLKFFCN